MIQNAWFLDPALGRGYPEIHAGGVPPALGIRPGDMETVSAPLDFIGVNLYMRTGVVAGAGGPGDVDAVPAAPMGFDEGPRTDAGWEVWPDAMYDMLMRLTRDYGAPELEITENGCSYADAPDETGDVLDHRRVTFYRGYLEAVARAIDDGADVRGYHAWSLLDNFEWHQGYHERFGLVWVDFETGARTLKASGRFYGEVAAANGFDC